MERASRALARIEQEYARGRPPAVFLDFDGTLAPIVARPGDAHLSKKMRRVLRALAERFPVAVISGRDLADIEARIGIEKVVCAGGHGLEWTFKGRHHGKEPGERALRALSDVRRKLLAITPAFPDLVIEDKQHSFALNYRALPPAQEAAFLGAALSIVAPFKNRLRTLDELSTFEVLPRVAWNKGKCVLVILRELQKSNGAAYLPVYLGDSLTDEDAFRALPRGVTIRIGGGKSAARHRLSKGSVGEFLAELLRLPEKT